MKKILSFALLAAAGGLLFVSTPILAQGTSTPPANPPPSSSPSPGQGHRRDGGRWQKALSQLNLSADQKAKIKSIMSNRQALGPKATHDQIEAVLTPEQKTQLHSLMQQAKQGHPPGGQAPGN